MEIIYTNGSDKRFIEICKELDKVLNEVVGQETQKDYDKYNTLENIKDVILILNNREVIGCGSFKKYEESIAEIKRVFVKKEERHKGIGQIIINEIEKVTRKKGYKELLLETNVKLKPAQNMYEKLGFYKIENFGEYKNMTTSVCMKKCI